MSVPKPGPRMSAGPATIGLALVVLIAPFLWQLAADGRYAKFGFVAPDTFYYLTVARNVVEHGTISFDQFHPTNAFHPLWQLICVLLYALGKLFSLPEDAVIVAALVTGLLFIGVGLVAVARAMPGSSPSPLFVALPLGAYALALYGPLGSSIRWGTLWGYANGMESGVLLGLYGLLALAFVRLDETKIRKQAPVFGLLCALLSLSRLDHAILPALILLSGFLRAVARRDRDRVRFWLASAATSGGLLVAYLIFNVIYSGAALPVSGSLKSTFPSPVRDCFVHTVNFFRRPETIGTTLQLRLAQLVVPFVAAVAWGSWMRARRQVRHDSVQGSASRTRRKPGAIRIATASPRCRYEEFLVFTAWTVGFVFLYDFLFVRPFDQGFWYTPVSVLFVSLALLHLIGRTGWHGRLMRSSRFRIIGSIALAATTIGFYAIAFDDPGGDEYGHFYYVNAPQARAHYASTAPRLLSNDDGIVAYALGFPTMNAIGVMLDAEAARAASRSHLHLFDLAYARGVRHFTSCRYTRGYREGIPVRSTMSEAELRDWMGLSSLELPDHELRADFISQDGLFAVNRFVPRRMR